VTVAVISALGQAQQILVAAQRRVGHVPRGRTLGGSWPHCRSAVNTDHLACDVRPVVR
jgi:hypothetical protein